MNTMSSVLDVVFDPPIRYEFIVIWSDSAVFGICLKNVN